MAGPLSGITILDLTWALSGPFGTMVLGDLGAEVIKVERPLGGDIARWNGPFVDGVSTYFFSINRGKKSIVLDLKTKKGKKVFVELVKRVDVLAENFVPGTMEKLGLGYEVLRKHNPRLVYAACSGFGQTGPYAQKPALDVIVQGMGGVMSITGEPDGPPVRVGTSIGDIAAGLFMAIGILAALQERERSGLGQMIDVSMLDCQVAILENAFVRYFGTGQVPKPIGTRHPVVTPFQAFPTKDGYIVLALAGMSGDAANHWALFCERIDCVELIDDPRFQTGTSRTEHHAELEPILSEALKKRTTAEWLAEFEPLGMPCGPLNTIAQAAKDPQILAREMIVEVPHPKIGGLKVPNSPIKLSRTPAEVKLPPPELGEHTGTVLSALLGMSDAEIASLLPREDGSGSEEP